MNSFTYNGTSSSQWGLLVTATSIFGSPAPDYENVAIAGRNGELTLFNNRYENIQISYDVAILDNFKTSAREIVSWLLSDIGYHVLTDTYDPNYYRKARYLGDVSYITYSLYTYGTATITFDCMPQRFLVDSPASYYVGTGTATLTNPTDFPSKPTLLIQGTGTVVINGFTITVNSAPQGRTKINSETQQCYYGTTNLNNYVTIDEFPVLSAGDNTIEFTDITSLGITPYWWCL